MKAIIGKCFDSFSTMFCTQDWIKENDYTKLKEYD